jgi:hypothetical protein
MQDIVGKQRLKISKLRALLKHILYAIEYDMQHGSTSIRAYADSIRLVLKED